ncbi:AsmA family protein [Filimonas effusa]|uniref:Uncharacterized protein n=1 Tax=Filimonas effusa TaxID=2508721 RepID=A0A4Q1CZZ0_9BACT|nr:AsmA-like C-terminal region-containing protein [Filimonas effusa]RXK80988.1 hypothetical protein ESB13_22815 [Filimonas effusa]
MREWMRHKVVRIAMWSILSVTGLLLVLLVCIQSYITAHRQELLVRVHEQLQSRLQGKLTIGSLEVNVWRHLPRVEIILKGVTLTDTVYQRPILSVQAASTRIGLFEITGKDPVISRIKFSDGYLHVLTDTTGYSNRYLLQLKKKDQSNKNPGGNIMIAEVELENIDALAEDRIKNKRFEFLFKKLNARIKRHRDSTLELHIKEDAVIRGLGFNLAKGSFLGEKQVEGRWKLSYRPASKQLEFSPAEIKFQGQPIVVQGSFNFRDPEPNFRLGITARKIIYKNAGALLTERLAQKLAIVDLEKPFEISAAIAGSLKGGGQPSLSVSWKVKDNRLVTPVAVLDSCSFSGSFTNERIKGQPLGDENSQIVIKDFTGKWGAAVFKGSTTTLTNLAEPAFSFDLYSDCSFPALNNQFGLRSLQFVEGRAKIALHYRGPLVKNTSFFQHINGSLAVENGAVHYAAKDLLFTNCNGTLYFGADTLQMNDLKCKLGDSEFTVNVDGKEMSSLAQDDDPHNATLSCSVYTPSLNLADFRHLFKNQQKKPVEEKKKSGKTSHSLWRFDQVLEKGSLRLQVKADALKLNHFTAEALTGTVLFRDSDWQLRQVSVRHAGGLLTLNGDVKHLSERHHDASVNMVLKDMDVRKVFYAFDNFGQKAISYSNLRGKLNTDARLRLALNERGDIIPGTTNGRVWFSLKDGALVNHEPVQKIQKFVFKDRDMSNITFAAIQDSLIIVNDEIEIKRMEIHSSVMTLYVEGLYSLKGNTDISIQVPLHNFLSRGDEKHPQNRGVDSRNGPSIYLRAKPDVKGNIKLGLDLFKKFRKRGKGKLDNDRQNEK